MNNWKSYFKEELKEKRNFFLKNISHSGYTELLIFEDFTKKSLTEIHISILENNDLISFEIINPITPGFTKKQEQEYFYKYDFDENRSYGNPGLEFSNLNKNHFNQLLKNGLKGKEVQYYKNKKIIKSEVYVQYGEIKENIIPTIIHFQKRKFWRFFLTKTNYDEERTIKLESIFGKI